MRIVASVFLSILASSCAAQAPQLEHRWTRFEKMSGQPEPVPAEWVATPEGRFAHSLKIPNPVPKDSGYRTGMTSQQYFEHLCEREAGQQAFRSVRNVEGIFFARPPRRPTDSDLSDLYRLEAPSAERYFQLLRANPADRSMVFVHGRPKPYRFVEELLPEPMGQERYVRAFGFKTQITPREVEKVSSTASRYGVTWRGIRRPVDRENAIAGAEWLVYDLSSTEVLGVFRDYARTGFTKNTKNGVWWLNAITCSGLREPSGLDDGQKLHRFVSSVLVPTE